MTSWQPEPEQLQDMEAEKDQKLREKTAGAEEATVNMDTSLGAVKVWLFPLSYTEGFWEGRKFIPTSRYLILLFFYYK